MHVPPSEILVARDGQEFGPFTRAQLVDGLQRGDLRRDDWAWWAGLKSWVPLGSLFPPPAPPPPRPAQKSQTKPVAKAKTGRAVRVAASGSTAGAIAGEAVSAGVEAAGGAAVEGCFSGCALMLLVFGGGTAGLAVWLAS